MAVEPRAGRRRVVSQQTLAILWRNLSSTRGQTNNCFYNNKTRNWSNSGIIKVFGRQVWRIQVDHLHSVARVSPSFQILSVCILIDDKNEPIRAREIEQWLEKLKLKKLLYSYWLCDSNDKKLKIFRIELYQMGEIFIAHKGKQFLIFLVLICCFN